MKSVYLFDSSLRLIRAIENTGYIKINTVATQSHYVYDQQLIKEANPFLSDTLFLHNSAELYVPDEKVDIDFRIIEKFRPTQYKVEQYLNRLDLEQYSIQYIYYRLLSFFYKRFKNNSIDAVITVLPLHGSPLEMIPIDMAIYFNKPVFTFDKLYANPDGFVLWGIWDYHKKNYLDLSFLNNAPELKNYLFYETKRKFISEGKPLYTPSISKLNNIGKALFTLKNLRDKKNIRYKATINSLMGKIPVLAFNFLRLTNKAVRYNYKTHLKTVKSYKNLCSEPDLSQPYIYYPLHLDPEASTLVREELSNQLTIIKILSDSLPEGYTLLVKEHPIVFSFLKLKTLKESWYFYLSLRKFRSTQFYEEIMKLPKVSLVPMNFSSKELIQYTKAVATINGTISLEAATINKPVLLFGDKLPFKYLKGTYNIASSKDCLKAMNEIKMVDSINYNLKEIEKYLFEMHVKADAKSSLVFDSLSEITQNLTLIIKTIIPD